MPQNLPQVVIAPSIGLSSEPGEYSNNGGTGTAWWKWVAPQTGIFHLDGNNVGIDAYTGTSVSNLNYRFDHWYSDFAFSATAGETIYFRATVRNPSIPLVILSLRADAPPANDNIAAATGIAAPLPQTYQTDVTDATWETDEWDLTGGTIWTPKSVWWKFTAPASGTIEMLVESDESLGQLTAFRGNSPATIDWWNQTDDWWGGDFIAIPVFAGETYYLSAVVPGYVRGTLDVTFRNGPPAPVNDGFATPTVISGFPQTFSGTIAGATPQPEETVRGGYPIWSESSVWFQWTAPFSGRAVLEVEPEDYSNTWVVMDFGTGSTAASYSPVIEDSWGGQVEVNSGTTYRIRIRGRYYDASGGAFSVRIFPPPSNDDFAAATTLASSTTVQATGTNEGAGTEPNEPVPPGPPLAPSVWWKWVAPSSGPITVATTLLDHEGFQQDARLTVFTGGSLATLSTQAVAQNRFAASINAVAGTTYYFRVDSPDIGTVLISVSPPPVNDQYNSGTVISGPAPIQVTGNLLGATGEATNPPDAGQSVWYFWTASWSGETVVRVGNRTTRMAFASAVFTGSFPNLLPVASDPDSQAEFEATIGTTYAIRVDRGEDRIFFPADFLLTLAPVPPNDSFDNPTVLSGSGPITSIGWNLGSSDELNEPHREPRYIKGYNDNTVWWRWTAPASGLVTVDTFGTLFDTILHVYTGTAVDALTIVRASDDARAELDSKVSFVAQAGVVYNLRVAGVDESDKGAIVLNLATAALPSTAADHLAYGRSYLEGRTAADLTAADQHFQQALALAPNDPATNALRAITRLADLQNAPAFTNLLTQWGIQTRRGGLHRPEFDTTKDLAGVRSAPLSANAAQGAGYLNSEVLPVLVSSESNLQPIAPGFTLALSDSETCSRWMNVDYGDVQILRALGFASQAAIRMNNTLDTDGSINDVLALENQKKLKAEHVLKLLPNLLKRRAGPDERGAFKTALQQSNTRYQAGSSFIRARVDSPDNRHHLFHIGAERTRKEEELRENATAVSQGLDGATTWAGYTVNLTPLLTTTTGYRDLAPKIKGDQAVVSTAPDPTVKNSLPGGTQAMLNQILDKNHLLYFFNSFADWAAVFLGDESAGNQAPGGDADHDGLSNYAEYVFALDPLHPSAADEAVSQGLVAGANPGDQHFAITFARRKAPTSVIYKVWVSDDLTSWDTTETQLQLVGAPIPQADDLTEQVTYRLALPVSATPKKFLKVVATGN